MRNHRHRRKNRKIFQFLHPDLVAGMFLAVAQLHALKLFLKTKIFISQLSILHSEPLHFLVTLSVKAAHSRSVEIYEKAGDKHRNKKRCGKWQCPSDKTFTARPIHLKKTPYTTTYAGVAKTDSHTIIATVFLYIIPFAFGGKAKSAITNKKDLFMTILRMRALPSRTNSITLCVASVTQ